MGGRAALSVRFISVKTGLSITCSRMKRPTPVSRMPSRNGTRQPHARN
jgi:hypothetical protein